MTGFKGIFYGITNLEGSLWAPFLINFVILIIVSIILSIRYKIILHFLNEHASFLDSFNIFCSSHLISYISPFRVGAVVTKPIITKAVSAISFKKSTLAAVFEQFYEIMWQILILPVLIYPLGRKYFPENIIYQVTFILISLAAIVFSIIHLEKIVNFFWKFKSLTPKSVMSLFKKRNISKEMVLQLIGRSRAYLTNRGMLFYVTLPTIAHFFLSPVILLIFLQAFGYSLNFFLVLSAYWVSVIVGRISGLPSGLGSREATLGAILVSYGVSVSNSIKIVLLARTVVLVQIIIFGLAFIIYDTAKFKDLWKQKEVIKEWE